MLKSHFEESIAFPSNSSLHTNLYPDGTEKTESIRENIRKFIRKVPITYWRIKEGMIKYFLVVIQ